MSKFFITLFVFFACAEAQLYLSPSIEGSDPQKIYGGIGVGLLKDIYFCHSVGVEANVKAHSFDSLQVDPSAYYLYKKCIIGVGPHIRNVQFSPSHALIGWIVFGGVVSKLGPFLLSPRVFYNSIDGPGIKLSLILGV